MKYNHETMFEGVKNVWNDGGGCHWCGRKTNEPFDGHDGFCPVPAMLTLEAENEALREHSRNPKELAGQLYWFADEGNHTYDMDDGGTVIIERSDALLTGVDDVG